ncbi:sulfotransferase domain-containing protein [Moorena sp. SIO4G3]|uniref:sulfotransferase domain-containing protein n=1 Tax=Moorena sp. SIO4G3 TaxID=2607821 RepID=UPI00142BE0F3|nr:sulfotransferase domain-containing protein [Moorena sp. SIO4G3]NEO78044.1 sulfotransferase domain-containing protein [Moorena sp. SIO4G3]
MVIAPKIVYYPDVTLEDLDAGVIVAYPLPDETHAYYAVPNFMIIGAQKCGTRELHTWLDQHPNLKGAPEECHFFDEVIDIETEWIRYLLNPAYLLSRDKEQLLSRCIYTFEKTPAYLDKWNRSVPIPELVRGMMPSGKFIVLLRNPTARAYSAYQMGRAEQDVIGAIPEYVDTDFVSLIKRRLSASQPDPYDRLLNVGHYALHLETWLNYFSREQLWVVLLEDFQRSPFEVMEKILTFLTLAPFDYRSLAEQNSRGLWVLRGQPSKGNAQPYEAIPQEAKALLDEYYAPWNKKLRQLMPELDIKW